MIHSVLVTFTAVAEPFAASVLEPVVPAGDSRIVSVVIAIVMTPAPFWLMNVIAVPMGKATEPLAGMVKVRAVVSAEGCRMCLPESARTSVYAADWEFWGMVRKPTALVPSTVQLDSVPEDGVPSAGVTRVGLFANTKAPEPVSLVTAAAKFALVGVPRNVATPEPKDVMPVPPLATGRVPVIAFV